MQRIDLVQHESRVGGELRAQERRQITVDLDRIERSTRGAHQVLREGTAPGPDLHQTLAGLRIDRAHDALDHRAVVEEMLTETLAARWPQRLRTGQTDSLCPASSIASPTAAARLLASARPLPARSSAVP